MHPLICEGLIIAYCGGCDEFEHESTSTYTELSPGSEGEYKCHRLPGGWWWEDDP